MPCQCLDRALDASVTAAEAALARGQYVYLVVAALLISWVSFTFFATILHQILVAEGPFAFAFNLIWGTWITFNILFNYSRCAMTSPGTTKGVGAQVLRAHVDHDWRWCRKCSLPKPPLAHHCSICKLYVKYCDTLQSVWDTWLCSSDDFQQRTMPLVGPTLVSCSGAAALFGIAA